LNSNARTPITIAKIGRKFGVRGYFNLISYTSPPENILKFKQLLIKHKKTWVKYTVESIKPKNKNIFICKLEGIKTPEEASKLTNCEAAIAREQLPDLPPEDYYWVDLMHLKVNTENGQLLGTIEDIIETPANDILSIKPNTGQPILIPYTSETVTNINLDSQTMTVDWDIDNT
jgi:16S rRNA processing protein RimM